MQKIFSFKGITRNTDSLYCAEGECEELVNLRHHNGVLTPFPTPDILASLPCNYSAVYRHEQASAYLCITADDGSVHLFDDNFVPLVTADKNILSEMSPQCKNVKRIEFMGNIVCLFTDTTTMYAIFDSTHYIWLGERPPMPSLSFEVTSQVHELTTESSYIPGIAVSGADEALYWANAAAGYYDECVAKLHERGCYIDRALFRYAFRLFDGSYAYFSPIYYVDDRNRIAGLYRDSGNFYSYPITPSSPPSKYKVKVQGFKPKFVFEEFDITAWENIIISVDIFTSGSVPGHKVVNGNSRILSRRDSVYTSDSSGYDKYEFKTTTEIHTDVASTQLFYKVAEFDLNGKLVDELKDVSQSNLALSTSLGEDAMSLMGRTAQYTYVFNGRLHLANLNESYFKGYNSDCFVPATMSSVSVPATVCTELKTTDGVVIVSRTYDGSFMLGCSDGAYFISPYIMYPDARAVKMTFAITVDGVTYCKTFPLTRHRILDIAYYLHENGDGITVSLSGEFASSATVTVLEPNAFKEFFSHTIGTYELKLSDNNVWLYGDTVFTPATSADDSGSYGAFLVRGTVTVGDKIIVTLADSYVTGRIEEITDIEINSSWQQLDALPVFEEQNCIDKRSNVMKVSEVDNPFYFPSKQTYTPSRNSIVAVCSNTVALSQGQFGQHPLYVLCTDGIWAMSTDASGAIAYTSSYPLSREVCVNAFSVKGVDSGVVFVSRKGAMLLNGGEITLLSSDLEEPRCEVSRSDDSTVISRIAGIVSLQNVVRKDNFFEYMLNAKVGFFYAERELLFSNPNYTYSYILSLNSGRWSKYTGVFDYISNTYPHFIGIVSSENETKVCTVNSDKVDWNSVMLLSRPLLCGTKLHKRILQLVLHASVVPAASDGSFNGLACYILGSNDGKNYKLISGSERRKEFSDMAFPYMPSQSYRYFSIAIVGCISTASTVVAAEMAIGTAWNNRLN